MEKTKISTLIVICESCNKKPHVMFIDNPNKHICDICGKIKNRVCYTEDMDIEKY